MSREADTPRDLTPLESALASLMPATVRVDRDRLMYQAGQASAQAEATTAGVQPRAWLWPTAAAGMSTVAAALFVLLVVRPQPAVVERIVYVPAEGAPVAKGEASAAKTDSLQQPPPGPRRTIIGDRTLAGGWTGLGETNRRPAYLGLRDQVLAFGVDVWQKPSSGSASVAQPGSYREALDSLLNLETSAGEEPPPPDSTSPDAGAQL
jgi:hypothetical protein